MNIQKLKHELEKHFGNEYDNYSVVFRNDKDPGKYSDVDYFLRDDEKKQIVICQEWY